MRSHSLTRSMRPPGDYVIVYDDACPFCSWCARFVARHARHPVRLVGFRELPRDEWLTALSDEEVQASSHLIANTECSQDTPHGPLAGSPSSSLDRGEDRAWPIQLAIEG